MRLLQNKKFYLLFSLPLIVLCMVLNVVSVLIPAIIFHPDPDDSGVMGNVFYFASVYNSDNYVTALSIAFILIFVLMIICGVMNILLDIFKPSSSLVFKIISFILSFVGFIFAVSLKEFRSLTPHYLFAFIIYLLVTAENILYLLNKEEKKPSPRKEIIINAIFAGLSLVSAFIMIFIPFIQNPNSLETEFLPVVGLIMNAADAPSFSIGLVFFIIFILFAGYTLTGIKYFVNNREIAYRRTRIIVYGAAAINLLFYLTCVIEAFITHSRLLSGSLSYLPFVISAFLVVLYAYLSKDFSLDTSKHKVINLKSSNVIAYLFLFGFTALTFVTILGNIVTVEIPNYRLIEINGYEIVRNYKDLGEGYQLLAFFLFIVIISTTVLYISATIAFIRRSPFYPKLALIGVITTYLFIFAIGLFGKYYEIAQKMNVDEIKALVNSYGYEITVDYTVKSYSLLFFLAATLLMIVLVIFDPFHKINYDEMKYNPDKLSNNSSVGNGGNETKLSAPKMVNFDSCPAFSEIDSNNETYELLNKERLEHKFENLTLSSLVSFVVEYARDSRLHLSYSKEDIAQFVAGLGATRLSILQGMSGTGKTSLPKIFIEALMGNCEIVEVESSWKDKNELIGYYNEFSKTFTPKKFTQALYRAKLNEDNIYFIVLDEMNLSRIEYYFSDFLSLMENEEDKREIKLLNVKLYRYDGSNECEYLGLTNGHTIKIPKNVWFIGTANRDESTFEISDKVYDRANTINFNKRAPKVTSYGDEKEPLYVSYTEFKRILDNAKNNVKFDIESHKIFTDVEEILAPFNISFGNRIAKQIEEFVKIYCSCFDNPAEHINDAIERILLSKVVAKLEYRSVEDKESLVKKFTKLGLNNCAAFVAKLNEDF